MQAVKAIVKNGRLVVNEPTDRPEGEVVELVPLDEVLASGGDHLVDEERAALHQELEASIIEAEAGNLIDADQVLEDLRANAVKVWFSPRARQRVRAVAAWWRENRTDTADQPSSTSTSRSTKMLTGL